MHLCFIFIIASIFDVISYYNGYKTYTTKNSTSTLGIEPETCCAEVSNATIYHTLMHVFHLFKGYENKDLFS